MPSARLANLFELFAADTSAANPRPLKVWSAKERPVSPIIAPAAAGRRLMATLKQEGFETTMFRDRPDENEVSIFCRFSPGYSPDRLSAYAKPVVELIGAESLVTTCALLGISVMEEFLKILVAPNPLLILNWDEGPEHSLPAILQAVVHVEDNFVRLFNVCFEGGRRLRLGSIIHPRR